MTAQQIRTTPTDHAAREENQRTAFVADVLLGFAEWEQSAPNQDGRDEALIRYVLDALATGDAVFAAEVLEQIDRARMLGVAR